jgi:ribosomal protein L44E
VAIQTPSSYTPITQTSDVHNVKSTNPKGNQKTEGKRKYKNNKGKGDNKAMNNVGKGKNEKRKVNFLCNICTDDHLTHQFPRLEEAQNLLAQQQPTMLTNHFP